MWFVKYNALKSTLINVNSLTLIIFAYMHCQLKEFIYIDYDNYYTAFASFQKVI